MNMVAPALPAATSAAPSATPVNGQSPPEAGDAVVAAEGGFLGTLMQMLAPQDPAEVAGAGGAALVTAVVEDDAGDPSGDAVVPEGGLVLAAMVMPPVEAADIRTARQLAREVDASASLDALPETAAVATASETADFPVAADKTRTESLMATLADAPAAPASVQGAMPQPTVADAGSVARTSGADAPGPRHIHAPVGSPDWSDELGTQLHLMADKGHSVASLRLSPEHLGPLEVQITVQDDQASVWFGASNVDTRAALEQALPRLKEMFAAQGMSLMQSGVFNQSPREGARQATGQVRGLEADGKGGRSTCRARRSTRGHSISRSIPTRHGPRPRSASACPTAPRARSKSSTRRADGSRAFPRPRPWRAGRSPPGTANGPTADARCRGSTSRDSRPAEVWSRGGWCSSAAEAGLRRFAQGSRDSTALAP